MKSTYKYLALQGYALSPTAPGHNLANVALTHFSEYSQVIVTLLMHIIFIRENVS